MLSDIAKRNIWLVLSVMTFACVILCAVKVLDGTAEWWKIFSITVIFAATVRFYIIYRNKTCGRRQSGQ